MRVPKHSTTTNRSYVMHCSFVRAPCVLLNTKWLLLRTRKGTWKGDRKLCWIYTVEKHCDKVEKTYLYTHIYKYIKHHCSPLCKRQ